MSMKIDTFKLLYFSMLQEKAGKSEEERDWQAGLTVEKLFKLVCDELNLDLSPSHVRASINHEFCDWQAPIAVNDVVAFIPPVAGG